MKKELPHSLLKDLAAVNGFDEEAFAKAHIEKAVTSLRSHPVKKLEVFNDCARVPWCSDGRYLNERGIFTLDPAYHAGSYYVQEASSMFTGYLFSKALKGKKELRVLDLCAAPGGKSTHIAALMDPESLLIANDVIRSRASILDENMTRWGYMNTWVTSNDPAEFEQFPGYFDAIIVDAPCSGSGLFRKDERALDEWSEANVRLCCERQQRILANIIPALKQDGILMYATCSYSPQEDEQILDWLAGEYKISGIEAQINEDWGIVKTASPKHKITGYRFFPDKLRGEGFFITAIRKNDDTGNIKPNKQRPKEEKNVREQASHLLQEPENVSFIKNKDEGYSAIRPAHHADLLLLQSKLYFRKTGISIGSPTAKEWIPAHDLALSIDASLNIPKIALNKEQALKFLKKEETGFEYADKGWFLMSYEGLGLGWIKALGNRANNYLPKSWRIRMELPDEDVL